MCDEAWHKGAYTLVPCNMEGQVNGFISVVHFLAHSSSVEWGHFLPSRRRRMERSYDIALEHVSRAAFGVRIDAVGMDASRYV